MSVVILKIADYSYKIACQDGQEARIQELATYLDEKAKKLLASVGGYIPENQLLAMVSVLTTQELFNARKQQPVATAEHDDSAMIGVLNELTQRINALTDKIKKE